MKKFHFAFFSRVPLRSILFLLGLFLIGACAQKQVKERSYEVASWETRAQVRNLQKNQTHNISIDVYAVKNEKLRLDATSTLGFQLATLVMNRENIQALAFREKKYFVGSATQEVLDKAFRVPLPPMVFFAAIFDQPISAPGWHCDLDSAGVVQKCRMDFKRGSKGLASGDFITLDWERLESSQKIVRLKTKTFEMDWLFKVMDVNWEPKTELFTLARPINYQLIQL